MQCDCCKKQFPKSELVNAIPSTVDEMGEWFCESCNRDYQIMLSIDEQEVL